MRISVTFTWDIAEGKRLLKAWQPYYSDVQLGGPAFGDPGGEFVPGRFMKRGVTITSRGCPKRCKFCFVPKREGGVRELDIKDGWIIQDNNLLACSREHIEKVFDMFARQPHPISFNGGLDATRFRPWHRDLINAIRVKDIWFACDHPFALRPLGRVAELLADMSVEKKRCYVLIGFDGEAMADAEKRLEAVFRLGFLPFAQLFKGVADKGYSPAWYSLQRKWSRPAAYRSAMKAQVTQ